MWVDEEVRDYTVDCEWHIFRIYQTTDDTFLSVSAGELVTQFGDAIGSKSDSNQTARVERFRDEYIVDEAALSMSDVHTRFSAFLGLEERSVRFFQEARWAGLADQNLGYPVTIFGLAANLSSRSREAGVLKVCIGFWCFQTLDFVETCAWDFDFIHLPTGESLALCIVGSNEC